LHQIVSLTTILKCLFNYGIKIYQNIAYPLTIQNPYYVDRNMFGATSFANAIKPKPFDGSNFKRWRELATLWLTAMNVIEDHVWFEDRWMVASWCDE
jgi:hypothetical protein